MKQIADTRSNLRLSRFPRLARLKPRFFFLFCVVSRMVAVNDVTAVKP